MPDLREELGRLADFVGEPVGMAELAAARRRRERRRRTAGLVGGVAALAVVALVAFAALRAGGTTTTPVDSTSPTPPPLATCASEADGIRIVAADLRLSGCAYWPAGKSLDITFVNKDEDIMSGLSLYRAARCGGDGCTGQPVWAMDLVKGPAREAGTIPPLAAGSYILLDPVHPLTSMMPITVVDESSSPASWVRHTDPLGFSMDLPASWGISNVQDELVISAPGGDPYIQIVRVPEARLRDDSSFPLRFDDYQGNPQPHFWGDGQTFIMQWLTGTPDPPTPEQAAVIKRIVESIRFEPWQYGEVRHGLISLNLWNGYEPGHFDLQATPGGGLIYTVPSGDGPARISDVVLDPNACSSQGLGQMGVDAFHQPDRFEISCGGVVLATYRFDGTPDPTNQPPWDQPLEVNEGIRAWDGTLLLPDPAQP